MGQGVALMDFGLQGYGPTPEGQYGTVKTTVKGQTGITADKLVEAWLLPRARPAPSSDSFDRANSDALGSPWVESESVAGAISILDNRVRLRTVISAAAEAGVAHYDPGTPYGADQFSEWRAPVNGFDAWYFLVVRGAGTWDAWSGYACSLDVFGLSPGEFIFTLVKLTAFNWKTGNPFVDGVTLAQDSAVLGAAGVMRLYAVGPQIVADLFDDGNQGVASQNLGVHSRLIATDLTYATGKAGIAVDGDAAAGSPDMSYDDWRGGDCPLTFDHSVDEHYVENLKVRAGEIRAAQAEFDVVAESTLGSTWGLWAAGYGWA